MSKLYIVFGMKRYGNSTEEFYRTADEAIAAGKYDWSHMTVSERERYEAFAVEELDVPDGLEEAVMAFDEDYCYCEYIVRTVRDLKKYEPKRGYMEVVDYFHTKDGRELLGWWARSRQYFLLKEYADGYAEIPLTDTEAEEWALNNCDDDTIECWFPQDDEDDED